MSDGMMNMSIIGNLGADPEIKMAGKQKIANFRVAATTRERRTDDTWGEKTEWMNVVAFGNQANRVEKLLKKGSRIFVSGPFKTEEYLDKSQNKKLYMEVIVKEMHLL